MPRQYYHKCKEGCLWVADKIMSRCPEGHGFSSKVRSVVQEPGKRLGTPHFQAMKEFRPYTEYFEAGKPTVVTGRKHRDVLCEAHNKTYDTCMGHGQRPKPAADTITLDEVIEEVKRAPEPERSPRKADDPRRDPAGAELDGVPETLLPPITDQGLSRRRETGYSQRTGTDKR